MPTAKKKKSKKIFSPKKKKRGILSNLIINFQNTVTIVDSLSVGTNVEDDTKED